MAEICIRQQSSHKSCNRTWSHKVQSSSGFLDSHIFIIRYITSLADDNVGYSTLNVLRPALALLHNCQNHKTTAAIESPIVKLVLDGAKREAADRRSPIKKASVLTQSQIHQLVDLLWNNGVGVVDKSVSLKTWRTVVRIYTM